MKKNKKNLKKTNSRIPQGLRIGFLGGGQLARMMALKTHELGLCPKIYCQSSDEPAAQVTPYVMLGSFDDRDKLLQFLASCDVITFESEFLNARVLEDLSLKSKVPIFPEPEVMSSLQDRLLQKHSLIDFNLPTSEFVAIRSPSDLKDAFKVLGKSLVLKQRRNGYDGKGTFFVSEKTKTLEIQQILDKSDSGFIAEKKINFRRELAVILTRDRFGKIIHFPLVQSKQIGAKCDWIFGPIKHAEFKKLIHKLQIYLEAINYVGTIGFELFDSKGKLLINEVAPRVHNSGHYTQLAFFPDQFLAHVLAISGFRLQNVKALSKAFTMANILGESTNSIEISSSLEASLHLYGKVKNQKGRKMGHLNLIGNSSKKILKKSLKERRKVLR